MIRCAIYDRGACSRTQLGEKACCTANSARADALLSVRASERATSDPLSPAKTQEKIPKTGLAHTIFTGFFGALLGGA